MTHVSHPLIPEIVSAPARSRPQAPVRDGDKFVIREERPVDRPRHETAERNDHTADPVYAVDPVRPVDGVANRQAPSAQPDNPVPAAHADTETAAENHSTVLPAFSPVAPEFPTAGINGELQISEIAPAETPGVTAQATATATTAPTGASTHATSPTATPAGNGARASAAQLVGANGGPSGQASGPVAETPAKATTGNTVADPALASASAASAAQNNAAQNNTAVQLAAAAQPAGRPADRTTANGTANSTPDGSARENTSSRVSAAGGSSVLPSTMATDADAAITKAVFATAATASANTQTQPQTNNQILAQALAGPMPDAGGNPVAAQVSPPLSGDTMGVTQSFNAEMRAAIDAPTQAAAYTARGAVTPQPATEQIAMQISRAADQGVDRLSVQLKPAELGKVTIDLEIGPDNRMLAVISAERSETLDLLQRDARSLEKALAEAGVETDGSSLEFSLQGEDGSAENDRDGDSKLVDGAVMLPGDTIDADANGTLTNTPLVLPEGRLDIQV